MMRITAANKGYRGGQCVYKVCMRDPVWTKGVLSVKLIFMFFPNVMCIKL